ncbi:MAG TPA: methyltransferase domain-containing protein [Candidatus Portnoybacteria bacterium]|nr:methyltransferase domain-containing protein [Candidatus Portnoybacteria bacterium]MDD5752066.1 methyltransferase domain-containing protein [Candidatus Portnoybacteria bacterium]HOZ16416.1 methyltransferase domain-containing protein [Candidatus Portnoybacteria bacterium]HPH52033.1 methyltransferase domain-containing protein [Candidatus Portnoybacteria bacterium]HPJ80183.1 methyltransferase domain-containing protein [Candidatus Portnoybacteria bacterium]
MNKEELQKSNSEELGKWNDEMVLKYHREGTLFESKNSILQKLEKMRLKKIIKSAKLTLNDIVLDLGCGEGFLINMLPNIKRIFGIDISNIALKRATKLLANKENIKLQWGDARKLEFTNETFDKILCSEVLEHLPNPTEVIKEIHRTIKKNGLVIISVPDEKRLKLIMKIIHFFQLDKLLHAARKKEDYEWHLHEADKNFIYDICKNFFKVEKIYRTPPVLGYRFVAVLKKYE